MQDDIQRRILRAIFLVLRPIARALLKVGVGYREFSELAKVAFVVTATKDYGLRGRPTNISRVAVMTGLTRKEVKRLRERADSEEQFAVVKTTPVAHILHRWFTDKEFLSDKGKPVRLAFDGKGTTFTTLVKKFGGDVPPGAMRAELRRIDGILEDDAGNMLPKKRVVYNEDLHERLIGGLAGILYPAALNLAHNLSIDDTSERWPNLTASSPHVRDSDRGRFMRISADRIDDFAKSIDDTYAAYETLYDEERSGTEERAVGVGVFYFEEEKTESDVFF